jgi:hypothetical protein
LLSLCCAYGIDPGFQTDHLALVMMNPTQAGYDPERVKEFYRATQERIASLPGVESVAWASGMPFWNSASRSVVIEGVEALKKSESLQTVSFIISTDYFRTMGIPLVAGRVFSDGDREQYFLILAQDLGYGQTPDLMRLLEEVSRLLNTHTRTLLAPDFWLPYPEGISRAEPGGALA